jgi:hypothetical protein
VHVCVGGVFGKGPVDPIHGVPRKARQNYFSSTDPKEERSCRGFWLEGRGSVSVWYESHFLSIDCRQRGVEEKGKHSDTHHLVLEPDLVYRFQAEGGKEDKGNTLILISVVSEPLSVYRL